MYWRTAELKGAATVDALTLVPAVLLSAMVTGVDEDVGVFVADDVLADGFKAPQPAVELVWYTRDWKTIWPKRGNVAIYMDIHNLKQRAQLHGDGCTHFLVRKLHLLYS
jgi:hypothetical protein